jgi:hypothetical protein
MRRPTTLACNFTLTFAIHGCEAALALARSCHFNSYGSGLFKWSSTLGTHPGVKHVLALQGRFLLFH